MLKTLEKIGNKRPIQIIIGSANQNPNYKTRIDVKPIDTYIGSVVILNDMLEARISSEVDEFFKQGRHENKDAFYVSQSFLVYRDKTYKITAIEYYSLNKHLKDVENMYKDIGGYHMKCDEFKEMCR